MAVRQRCAEGALAAGPGEWRGHWLLRAYGTGRRLQPRRDADARPARWRRLGDRRTQAVVHQRHHRRRRRNLGERRGRHDARLSGGDGPRRRRDAPHRRFMVATGGGDERGGARWRARSGCGPPAGGVGVEGPPLVPDPSPVRHLLGHHRGGHGLLRYGPAACAEPRTVWGAHRPVPAHAGAPRRHGAGDHEGAAPELALGHPQGGRHDAPATGLPRQAQQLSDRPGRGPVGPAGAGGERRHEHVSGDAPHEQPGERGHLRRHPRGTHPHRGRGRHGSERLHVGRRPARATTNADADGGRYNDATDDTPAGSGTGFVHYCSAMKRPDLPSEMRPAVSLSRGIGDGVTAPTRHSDTASAE